MNPDRGVRALLSQPALAAARLRACIGRHPDQVALLTIVVVGLTIRLAFTFRAPVFLVHDSVTYFQAGYDFARGSGFDLAFKRTPLYPLFIAGVVAFVGEDLQALGFIQHLLGVVVAVETYVLGRFLFGRAAGLIAGLLVALSGPLIVYEHYVLAEPLFIPLLLGFAIALVKGVASARTGTPLRGEHRAERAASRFIPSALAWLALAGLLLGLSSLARPVGQALLVAVPPSLLLAFGCWRRAALGSLVVAVGLGAVTLPWMARNYATNGSFESAGALGQSLTGRIIRHDEGFVIPPPDSPSPYTDPIQTEARALILRQMARDARPSAINHRLRSTFGWSEAEANRAMRDVCLEIILGQKERYITGTVVKFQRLLWGAEIDFLSFHWGNRKSTELREDWIRNQTIAHILAPPTAMQENEKFTAMAITQFFSPYALRWPLFALLMIGACVGLSAARTRWATVFILLLTVALTLPAAALVGFVPRYRYPADPFLAMVIGAGLVCLLRLLVRPGRLLRGDQLRATLGVLGASRRRSAEEHTA